LANFLASSGSAGNYQYGSFYTIDIGVLAAGTTLTITHDDGASIFQGDSQIGTMTTGPTIQVTESVTLPSTADTILYYARENGSPSMLTVVTDVAMSGVQLISDVAEPGTLTLIGSGLVGFGLFRRRSATKSRVLLRLRVPEGEPGAHSRPSVDDLPGTLNGDTGAVEALLQ
jgi:PEP-CTERM motif